MLITRVHVGRGPGIVLISMASPSGELGTGPVENVEAFRVAMTYSTFREVAELLSRTAAEMESEESGQTGIGRAALHQVRSQVKN
jgi:hypothetical protein